MPRRRRFRLPTPLEATLIAATATLAMPAMAENLATSMGITVPEPARPRGAEPPARNQQQPQPLLDRDVFFAPGSDSLDAPGALALRQVATLLRESPGRVAIIEGYTDGVGSPRNNQQLAHGRASAGYVELLLLGASDGQLHCLTRGKRSIPSTLRYATRQQRTGFQRSIRVRVFQLNDPSWPESPRVASR